jgi:TatD DNase family protein
MNIDSSPLVDAPLIDCHAHLNWPEFSDDIDAVLKSARAHGVVGVLLVAMDQRCEPGLSRLVRLSAENADTMPHLARALGVHPILASAAETDLGELERLVDAHCSELAAVGECGLDSSLKIMPKDAPAEQNDATRERQVACLRKQIELAVRHRLPLNVHSRSAGQRTIQLVCDELAAIEPSKRVPVLMHAFDGKAAHAAAAAARTDVTFYFSVAPSIVRSDQLQKMVAAVPMNRLVLESDAPGLGPTLGVRNEPSRIVVSARAIAQIRQCDVRQVALQTTRNAIELFPAAFAGLAATLGDLSSATASFQERSSESAKSTNDSV